MASPAYSVVIPTWNGRELVDRLLRSLFESGLSSDAELIVVDDGSDDGTAEHIGATFPNVHVIRHEKNRGFGASCNTGITASQFQVVLLLNNDLIVCPDFADSLLAHFQDDRVFAVNPQVFQMDGQSPGGGLVRGYWHAGLLRLRWSDSEQQRNRSALTLYANGAACALSREKFIALGGFDSLYEPFYSEDLDLSYRAWQRGWEIRYEPQSRVRHSHGGTIKSSYSPGYVEHISRRNRILFVWRNVRDPLLLLEHIGWIVLRGVGAGLTGNSGFFRALYAALRKLPQVRARRRADSGPMVSDRVILTSTSEWTRSVEHTAQV